MLIANYLALANWLVRELSIAIFSWSEDFFFKTKEHVNKSSPKLSYYHYRCQVFGVNSDALLTKWHKHWIYIVNATSRAAEASNKLICWSFEF